MKSRVTIYDIAKKLDITAATVSRALNNNPKISAKTKQLVEDAAKEMGYKQNKLALALKSGKSNNVGIIVPRIDRNFFASVIRGIEETLYSDGYHVIICQTHEDEGFEIENIDALINAQVDGIFMSISYESQKLSEALQRIKNKGIPIVLFDRKGKIKDVSTVTIDDTEGGYRATLHLIAQGCRRIAHYAGDLKLDIYKERLAGYKRALRENDIPIDDEIIISTGSKVEAGVLAMEQLLKLRNPPDALFSSSDFAALGAIQELRKRKIRIPEDFCVVGFSNEPFTRFMELTISTVHQSPVEMGRISAEVFLEHIQKQKNKVLPRKVVLPPELLIRKSSDRKL